MNYIWTLLYGFIQGLTECLPVSSQAHVIFARHMLASDSLTAYTDNAFLHLGSAIALCILFLGDFSRLFNSFLAIFADFFSNLKFRLGLRRGHSKEIHRLLSTDSRCMAWMIFVSSLIAGVVGILLRPFAMIAANNVLAPGIGLFMTAIFLLVSLQIPPINKPLKNCKLIEAILIGLLEGCAVFPGLSRFAVVLAACSIIGITRKNQFRFALYSTVPMIFGSVLVEVIVMIADKVAFSPMILLGAAASCCATLMFGNLELGIIRKYQNRKFFVAWCFLAGCACLITYFRF